MEKNLVLIVGLLIFLTGLIIDLTTKHAVHVPMSFLTIPITSVYLLLGWMYKGICNAKMKSRKEEFLINLCIFYTSIFPILIIGGAWFLKIFLGIKVTQSNPSMVLKLLFYLFIGVQVIGIGLSYISLKRRFLKNKK